MGHAESKFQAANIAVLTVSDTRTEENDTSGRYLAEQLQEAGHTLADKQIVIDDMYKIRAVVSQWIADETIQAILITGGTGLRHVTAHLKHLSLCLIKKWKVLASCFAWSLLKRLAPRPFNRARLRGLRTTR